MPLNAAANTLKEPVAVRRYRHPVCQLKKRADQIVHDDVNSRLAILEARRTPRGLENLEQQPRRQTIGPTHTYRGFETEVGHATGSLKPQCKEIASAGYATVLHGTRCIKEDDVAGFYPHNTPILQHVGRAEQLRPDQKMLSSIPFDLVQRSFHRRRGVATDVGSFESAEPEGSHPADEGPLIIAVYAV